MTDIDRPQKSAAPEKAKRRYNNRQRQQQAEQTRIAILQALASQLAANNSADFSVAEAARDAGVTSRTVFRHFPTKESMLEALSEWVLGITGRVPIPTTPDELPETVSSSYQMFEDNAELMRALLLSDLGRGIRSRLSPRRREGLSAATHLATQGLPPRQAAAVEGVLNHLITADAWWHLRDAFGVQGNDSAAVVSWLIRLALNALREGENPFDRAPASTS